MAGRGKAKDRAAFPPRATESVFSKFSFFAPEKEEDEELRIKEALAEWMRKMEWSCIRVCRARVIQKLKVQGSAQPCALRLFSNNTFFSLRRKRE